MKLILVSGGFDPIHSGHIAYFKYAKSYGDKLIVALNSDAWLEKKKGKFFMPLQERNSIVGDIKYFDEVISFEHYRKGSCINDLEAIKKFISVKKFILLIKRIGIRKYSRVKT